MHLFLVNDDGIDAPGLRALVRETLARGHQATVCAPAKQQSAASHRITLTEPLFVEERDLPGARAFAVSGSPVDCVRLGLLNLVDRPVDLLISGINDGYNAGMAVHYSGTVGAAMEGAINRLPSVATSLHHQGTPELIDNLARLTLDWVERYARSNPPPLQVLNLNAPCVAPQDLKPLVYAPLDTGNFVDGYERRQAPRAGMYFWLLSGSRTEEPQPGSDMDYLQRGHVTATLIGNPESLSAERFAALGL